MIPLSNLKPPVCLTKPWSCPILQTGFYCCYVTGDNQVGNYAFVTDQPLKAMMQPLHWLRLKTLKSIVHGKGSKGLACWLPLLGEVMLILSNPQDINTSQHSAIFSCHVLSLWLLFDFCLICFLWLCHWLVVPRLPQQQAPQSLVTRSGVGSVRRTTHCGALLQGKAQHVPPTPSPTWRQRRSHNM